ncbi:hypothetical protein COO60DRAFT_1462864 [Scenedesmus sp. NREL 46B-D3]|nr:hypothetical protein COO60DRAFT_1462864 [Scenedesmus sp. NREL 46B-D3]
MHRYTLVAVVWGLLLSSLCCCSTATALECPSDVVSLESIATPTSITLQAGKSYELGPEGAGQLHFAQYGGLLKINNLQLQGRADSDGGGGVVIKRSKDGTDDNQPATFIARLVTFKSISPRAVANDDAAANLTFTNCAFLDNVYNTWGCENQREWFCSFTGPPGAAGVTTASNATFSGSTVFRRNSWGALYVASPVTVTFEGKLVVADNTKRLWGQGFEYDEDNFTTEYGAGLIASGGARLLFFGAVQIRNNTGFGGCGMYLSRASATFASAARTVQFTRNRGSYGAAMKAYESNVQFNGPVLMADNTAIEGAGGAFHLLLSNVTFNARATVRNNSLHGCTMDFDNGCGGGAMFVLGSQVTHADRATYLRNTASSTDGGALYITGYKYGTNPMNSSFLAADLVTFNGNSATRADKYASTSGHGAGNYNIEGNVCAEACSLRHPLMALGYKGLDVASLRNWHLLARKLSTPGSTVTIVTFGGSLTAGYISFTHAWQSSMEGSWVEQLVAWLQAAFPSITFNTLNLSRSASDVIVAATCWYQYVPQEADLVLVEYSVNGCRNENTQPACSSAVMPRVASYENLYRRVIRRAPGAALMSVAMFGFTTLAVPARDTANTQVQLPNPFSNSGEELHGMIARRYGAPIASLRDSLYDLMFNDEAAQQLLGATRSTLMAEPSDIHPTAAGFKVFGDVVAFTVRQTLAAVLANGAADPAASASAVKYAGGGDLPLPVSPVAGQQDTDTWIRGYFMKGHGQELQALVSTSTIAGSSSKTATASSNNTGADLVGDSTAENSRSDSHNAGVGSAAADPFARRYLAVTYLQGAAMPAERMAIAHVKCVRGCRCQPVQLTFHRQVVNGIAATEVSLHPSCVVRIDIKTDPATGGDEFAVTGIAVVAFSKAAPVHPIDSLDIAAGRAEGQQLPISWP